MYSWCSATQICKSYVILYSFGLVLKSLPLDYRSQGLKYEWVNFVPYRLLCCIRHFATIIQYYWLPLSLSLSLQMLDKTYIYLDKLIRILSKIKKSRNWVNLGYSANWHFDQKSECPWTLPPIDSSMPWSDFSSFFFEFLWYAHLSNQHKGWIWTKITLEDYDSKF